MLNIKRTLIPRYWYVRKLGCILARKRVNCAHKRQKYTKNLFVVNCFRSKLPKTLTGYGGYLCVYMIYFSIKGLIDI